MTTEMTTEMTTDMTIDPLTNRMDFLTRAHNRTRGEDEATESDEEEATEYDEDESDTESQIAESEDADAVI